MINSVVLVLCVSLLTSAFGWAFQGEVFAHELKHYQGTQSSLPQKEFYQHNNFTDDKNLEVATQLCLHAAGQYQPFFFALPPLLPIAVGKEILAVYIPVAIPESILESPLHPPRYTFLY